MTVRFINMYKGMSEVIYVFQVVTVAVFTTMEIMEKTEKGVKDFFMEGGVARMVVALEGEVEEVKAATRLVEVVEGTPGGAVEAMKMIPVEEGEVPTMLEKISKMNAVTIQLVMAA